MHWSNYEKIKVNISETGNTVCLIKSIFKDQMYPKSTQTIS